MASASIENLLEGLSSEELAELSGDIVPSAVSFAYMFALHCRSQLLKKTNHTGYQSGNKPLNV